MTLGARFKERILQVSRPLPGSTPYDNARRLCVQARYAGLSVLQFCCARHPHLGESYWRAALEAGRISYQDQLAKGLERVQAGGVVVHAEPDTVEPEVNAELELLYEDEAIVAFNKPAPLPVHPCGRFNKNTVTHLLSLVWPQRMFRPVHRLDANTTGVLVLAKSKDAARHLAAQFSSQEVEKRYLVEVHGRPSRRNFQVDTALTDAPGVAGSRRPVAEGDGLAARTDFSLLASTEDEKTLLEARPASGRTNQIRIHLAELGLPIVGDRAYGAARVTLGVEHALTTEGPLHLHAWRLALRSPKTGERLEIVAPPPPWAEGSTRPSGGE